MTKVRLALQLKSHNVRWTDTRADPIVMDVDWFKTGVAAHVASMVKDPHPAGWPEEAEVRMVDL